ncbi:MAG: hypothetical protein DWQ01_20060 [Planctomycetota bacterium]|nr:MAG: hypothetical protein DWQ01_20060 [Planctomycetota bacterium]
MIFLLLLLALGWFWKELQNPWWFDSTANPAGLPDSTWDAEKDLPIMEVEPGPPSWEGEPKRIASGTLRSLHTVDSWKGFVSGVQIFFCSANIPKYPLAITDENGWAQFRLPASATEGWILGEKQGYEQARASLETWPFYEEEQSNGTGHTLLMKTGSAFSGRLLLPNREPPPQGVKIVAWPENEPVDPETIRLGLAGKAPLHFARSDENGYFQLLGVSSQRRYSLWIGGNGVVSEHLYYEMTPKEFEKPIPVLAAFGAMIHAVDQRGFALDTQPRLYPNGRSFSFGSRAPKQARILNLQETHLVLLDVDLDDLALNQDPHRIFVRLGSPEPEDDVIASVSASFAGYRSRHQDFPLTPIQGDLAHLELRLEADPGPFGSLRLFFSDFGQSTFFHQEQEDELFGYLSFKQEDSTTLLYAVQIGDLLRPEGILLHKIPLGDYQLRFKGNWNNLIVPWVDQKPWKVTISSEPAELWLDLGPVGMVRFQPHNSEGEPITGRFSLAIRDRSAHGVSFNIAWNHPPYWVCLKEASYRFSHWDTHKFEIEGPWGDSFLATAFQVLEVPVNRR